MAPLGSIEALFMGRQFDQEIIVLCVRWYLRYKLSTRDLVEMMAERGAVLVHMTILRRRRGLALLLVNACSRSSR
jgi:transposase-like protein